MFKAAKFLPDSLPSDGGDTSGGHEVECDYWLGMAYAFLGDKELAR